MACRAVLYSLDENLASQLKALKSEKDRLTFLYNEIDTTYYEKYPERVATLDKTWDALHRCLTDGYLDYTNGTFPLNHVIMGGEILYTKSDFIITLKTPEQVQQIAPAIEKIDEAELRQRYFSIIDADDYDVPLDEEDFEYTWEWFEGSKPFWTLAARENRYVLFTVDQ